MASQAALPPGSYDTRVPTVVGVVIFTLAVATIAVGLRIYTRRRIINQLGVDDYFAIAALLIAYGAGIAIGSMTMFGLGKHVWMIQPTDVPLYFRAFYVSIVLYCAGLFAVKMTFLFQYYRVLAVQKLQRLFIVAIVLIGGWSLSQVFVGIFTCHPVSGFWDSTIEATCIPNLPQWYINAAGNIFTDIVIFVLPLPIISKLNLAKPQKIVLIAIFCLGFFTVAISVLRIKYLKLFEDFTWENVETASWSIAELSSGITCACLPTLRPFVTRHFPSLMSTRGLRSSRGYKRQSGSGDKSRRDIESAKSGIASKSSRNGSTANNDTDPIVTDANGFGKYGAEDIYELDRQESGDASEGIVGLQHARHGLNCWNKKQVEDTSSNHTSEGDSILGLRPTVKTKVNAGPGTPMARPDAAHLKSFPGGIQVQRDIYQSKQEKPEVWKA